VRRRLVVCLVAALTFVFGGVACSAEVQVDEPEELPVKVDVQDEEQGGQQG
jgi:hypothetical protein